MRYSAEGWTEERIPECDKYDVMKSVFDSIGLGMKRRLYFLFLRLAHTQFLLFSFLIMMVINQSTAIFLFTTTSLSTTLTLI